MEISKEDDERIWYLFYKKGYNIDGIIPLMNGRFTYKQIQDVIYRRYKKWKHKVNF